MSDDVGAQGVEVKVPIDFSKIKRMAKEFIDALPNLDPIELEDKFLSFQNACVDCVFPNNLLGRALREATVPSLQRIVTEAYERRLTTISNKDKHNHR